MLINTGNISRKVLSKVLRSFVKNFERLQVLQRAKEIILQQKEKLKAYEDIGLEPGEIEELKARGEVQKMFKPNPNIYCCPACGEKIAPMWGY